MAGFHGQARDQQPIGQVVDLRVAAPLQPLQGTAQLRAGFGAELQVHLGLQGGAEIPLAAALLELAVDLGPELEHLGHGRLEIGGGPLRRGGGPAPLKHRLFGHRVGQVLPDVFGHVAQHRGNQAGEPLHHQGQHGLAAAPAVGIGSAHIKAVFGNVEVDVGEVDHAEVLEGLEEAVELIALEIGTHRCDQRRRALQHPLIEQGQLGVGDGIAAFGQGFGVEVVQIAQQVAGGVAHLAVNVGELFDDPRSQGHIGGVVDRAHPEPQHIGAVGGLLFFVLAAFHQHRWIDDIAQGFAHLAALLIEGEAVGEHPLVGGVAVDGHRGEQAGLEPAPVLVGALQVEIGGVLELGHPGRLAADAAQDPGPRRAGVEPHVHGVGALAPVLGLARIGLRQEPGFIPFPPNVGAVLGNQGLDVAEGGFVEQHLAGLAVIKDRNGHAPGALAGDAPVAPLAHHRFDPVAAAGGQPLHLCNGCEGLAAEALHRGKPLLGGPEDRGFFGAPVVGVAVLVAVFCQ